MRLPRFSGKLSQFGHPKGSRHSIYFKLQMVLGRHSRFLQSSRIKKVRVVKPSIDDGSSLIVVPLKKSILRPLKFPKFSGKLSQFEHPERSRHSSKFKQQMVLGKHTRFLQSLRVNKVRAVKPSIDDGSYFVVVPLKESLLRPFRFPRFSGNLNNFSTERDQDIIAILNYK